RRSGARPESRPLRACAPCFCLDPGLRRDDDVVESRQIQSARLFRGDVLPTFVAPAPGRSPGLRAHGAPLLLDPGLRRDDDVVESRPDSKRAAFSWRCATDLRPPGARPESRPLRAWRAAFAWIPAYAGTTVSLNVASVIGKNSRSRREFVPWIEDARSDRLPVESSGYASRKSRSSLFGRAEMIDLRRWIRVGVPAVAAGFFSLGADASEEAESAATDVPTVNVWGILPEDVEDAPGAAAVLTADEIEKLRPYTLHDAFDFMPGLRALDDDALGRRSGIGIRGSPTRRSRNG